MFLKINEVRSAFGVSLFFALAVGLMGCSGNGPESDQQTDSLSLDTHIKSAGAPYKIRSARITYEVTDILGKQELQTSFDEFGRVQRSDMELEIFGTKIRNITISDATQKVSWDPARMVGHREKVDPSYFDKIDFSVLTEASMKELGITDKGSETILDRECKLYSIDQKDRKVSGTVAVWQGILLKSDMKIDGKSISRVATKIEENVNFPAEEFKVPENLVFKDLESL